MRRFFAPVLAFIRLGRPLFLVGGFILYGLGIVIALYQGVSFHLEAYIWGQLAVTATQLMTHYANEYFDFEADHANPNRTRWSGGSGVLVAAMLPRQIALITACVLATIALGAALVLNFYVETGALTLVLIALSILLAWFYSAPPLRLHSTGLGELATALLVPGLTPLVGFYLQAGRLDLLPILAAAPLAAFQFNMLLVIEFPDSAGDKIANKRTLVVRWGKIKAARLHNLVLLFAYLSLPLLILMGLPWMVALAVLAGLPLAGWQFWRMLRGAWTVASQWNSLAFTGIALLIGTAAAELAVFAALI